MNRDMGRVPVNRGPIHPLGVNGANAAVIEAPNEPENKVLLNKDQNEHEDEEVRGVNGSPGIRVPVGILLHGAVNFGTGTR